MTTEEIINEREEILEIINEKRGAFTMFYLGDMHPENIKFLISKGLEVKETRTVNAPRKGTGEAIKTYCIIRK